MLPVAPGPLLREDFSAPERVDKETLRVLNGSNLRTYHCITLEVFCLFGDKETEIFMSEMNQSLHRIYFISELGVQNTGYERDYFLKSVYLRFLKCLTVVEGQGGSKETAFTNQLCVCPLSLGRVFSIGIHSLPINSMQ